MTTHLPGRVRSTTLWMSTAIHTYWNCTATACPTESRSMAKK